MWPFNKTNRKQTHILMYIPGFVQNGQNKSTSFTRVRVQNEDRAVTKRSPRADAIITLVVHQYGGGALLHKSPWQKHMKTFLYSHTVSLHRSSLSDGPLCKHVLCVAVSNSCSLASELRVSMILPHHPEAHGTASTPTPGSVAMCVRLVYLKRSLQLPNSPRDRQLKQRLTTASEGSTNDQDANSSSNSTADDGDDLLPSMVRKALFSFRLVPIEYLYNIIAVTGATWRRTRCCCYAQHYNKNAYAHTPVRLSSIRRTFTFTSPPPLPPNWWSTQQVKSFDYACSTLYVCNEYNATWRMQLVVYRIGKTISLSIERVKRAMYCIVFGDFRT